ncbi:MAG: ABC transporter permease [Vicinamibacterales bacterium]
MVLIAAVSLAANTAVFSIVDAVFLQSASYPEADKLVHIQLPDDAALRLISSNRSRLAALLPSLHNSGVLTSTAFVESPVPVDAEQLTDVRALRAARSANTSAGLLKVLGLTPVAGRDFRPDDVASSPRAALLGEDLWRSSFAADLNVLGREVRVRLAAGRGEIFRIVGIAPAKLNVPSGANLWVVTREPKVLLTGTIIGRMVDGATLDQLRAIVPEARVRRLLDVARPGDATTLAWFLAASLCLFLIAWIQVGSLLTSRLLARRQEFRTRLALGGSQRSLQIHWAGEVIVLFGAAALVAAALVPLLSAGLTTRLPTEVVTDHPTQFGWRHTAVFFSMALVGVVAVSIVPLSLLRTASFQAGARAAGHRSARLWRHAGVVAQIVLVTASLYAAALVGRSYERAISVDLGFVHDRLWMFEFPTPETPQRASREANRASLAMQAGRKRDALERLDKIPDVVAVATGIWPLHPASLTPDLVRSPNDPSDAFVEARIARVSGNFFNALGIKLDQADTIRLAVDEARARSRSAHSANVPKAIERVFVNESYAYRLRQSGAPVGQVIELALHGKRQVAGVVPDLGLEHPTAPILPTIWMFYGDRADSDRALIRAATDDADFVPAVRAALADLWPGQEPARLLPLGLLMDQRTEDYRATAVVLIALLLFSFPAVGLGMYGWSAQILEEHRGESAIRLALGASRQTVRLLFVRRAAGLGLLGAVIGIAVGIAGGQLMRSRLFGVSPVEPTVAIAVLCLILMFVASALTLAVFRTGRIDPATILREPNRL